MKSSEKNEIVESLFQAIETITKKQMSGLSYDKTILCKIEDDTYRTKGEYTVTDGTSSFVAFSDNTTYINGTSVYVTIPASDYNNKKLIIGKYTDSDNDKYHTYREPFDDLLDVTGNIIDKVDSNALSILANGGTGTNQKEKVIWSKEWTDPTSFMEKIYSRMGLRAKFLTKFAGLEVAAGSYGLRLDIISREDTNQKTENTEKYYSCDFGVLDMYGDPYNFEGVPFLQEKVFDITEISQITYMQLVLYQKNDFLNIRKELITSTMGDDGPLPDNIIVSDVYLSLGYAANEFTEDTVLLYTYDPTTYVATVAEKDLLRTIEARWVHFESSEDTFPMMIDKVDEIPDLEGTDDDYTKIHWYRFNLNESVKDEIAGNFWTEIRPLGQAAGELAALSDDELKALAQKYNYVLDITIPENDDGIEVITDVQEVLTNAAEETFTSHPNLLSQPVKVDKTMAEERYKVIIECPSRLYCTRQMINEMATLSLDDFKTEDDDGIDAYKAALKVIKNEWQSQVRLYYSDDFVFKNEEQVANAATIDAIRGLKILCDEEGLKGEYCIYGSTNEILNATEAKKIRTMKATYESLVTGESSLDKAESITWKIPLVNTMIYEPEHGHEFDNTKDKVEYWGYDADGNEVTEQYKSEVANPMYVLITRQGTEKYDVGENVEALQIEAQQTFRIKDYYVSGATNNTVTCTVVKNKVTVFATTSMVFGQQGSNGTDSTLLLRWDANRSAIHPGEALKVYAYLYDYENNPVEITEEHGMHWTWWSQGNDASYAKKDLAISSIEGDSGVNFCTISALSAANGANFCGWVLKGQLTYGCAFEEVTDEDGNILAEDGSILTDPETQTPMRKTRDVVLEAYLPIAVCTANVHFAEIADRIVYDANGNNPSYYKNPLRIFASDNELVSENLAHWSMDFDDNAGAARRFYPSIIEEKVDGVTNAYLKPTNMYYAGNDKAVTICWDGTIEVAKEDGTIEIQEAFWHQSLYIGQNRWPSAMLNAWDGSLTIDEKNGTILSTMVGAGKKNSDNTFSGVLMGDVLAGAGLEAAENHEGLGVYGFHHGDQSFGFNIEGTAFIGKSGRGRIYFDGNQGTITSGNYIEDKTGMQIDLDGTDGQSSSLFAFGGGGRFYLDTADNAEYLLRITDAAENNTNVNDLFVISTKETADGDGVSSKYYLQSSNFSASEDTGTRLDLQNGKFTTYGEKGYVIIDSSSDTLLRIAGVDGTKDDGSPNFVDLMTVGNIYQLQSLKYDHENQKGLCFDLNEGSIEAYTFDLYAGKDGNYLSISSDPNKNPIEITNSEGKGFIVSWDGTATMNKLIAIDDGQIGPFTITATALQKGTGGHGVATVYLGDAGISVTGNFIVDASGNVTMAGSSTIGGTLQVDASTTIKGGLVVEGYTQLKGGLSVCGNGYISNGSSSSGGGSYSGGSYGFAAGSAFFGPWHITEEEIYTDTGSHLRADGEIILTNSANEFKITESSGLVFTTQSSESFTINDGLTYNGDGCVFEADSTHVKLAYGDASNGYLSMTSSGVWLSGSGSGDVGYLELGQRNARLVGGGGGEGARVEVDQTGVLLGINGSSIALKLESETLTIDGKTCKKEQVVNIRRIWNSKTKLTFVKGLLIDDGLDETSGTDAEKIEIDTDLEVSGNISAFPPGGSSLTALGKLAFMDEVVVSDANFSLGTVKSSSVSGNTATYTVNIPGQYYSAGGSGSKTVYAYQNDAGDVYLSTSSSADEGYSRVDSLTVSAGSSGSGYTDDRTLTVTITVDAQKES